MFISTHVRSKLANKKWCINIPRWRSKARTSNTERRRHKEVMKAKSRANEFSRCRGESGKGSGWEGHPESRRNFTSQRDKSKKASALLNERAQVVVYLVAKTMPKMADQINSSLFSFVVRTNLCRCMSRVIIIFNSIQMYYAASLRQKWCVREISLKWHSNPGAKSLWWSLKCATIVTLHNDFAR